MEDELMTEVMVMVFEPSGGTLKVYIPFFFSLTTASGSEIFIQIYLLSSERP